MEKIYMTPAMTVMSIGSPKMLTGSDKLRMVTTEDHNIGSGSQFNEIPKDGTPIAPDAVWAKPHSHEGNDGSF